MIYDLLQRSSASHAKRASGVHRAGLALAGHLRLDHYTYFHPERAILGPMTLTLEASARHEGGSRMRVTQEGYQDGADWDGYYEAVRHAWPQVGREIVRYLETSR